MGLAAFNRMRRLQAEAELKTKAKVKTDSKANEKAKAEAELKAKEEAEAKAKQEAEDQAKAEADAKAKAEAGDGKASAKHKGSGKWQVTRADGTIFEELFDKETALKTVDDLNS